MKLEDIYTREWFEHDFAELQPEFDVVADSLVRQFRPRLAVDIGCGPGMLLHGLHKRGVSVLGFEGSQHGIEYARDRKNPASGTMVLRDITGPDMTLEGWVKPSDYEGTVIICTEVAEHLEACHADGLVKLLCSAMCPIVFTAAPPGQDGHHHVNLQPEDYWWKLFAGRGAFLDERATVELRTRWYGLQRLGHMRNNLMVFR